MKRYLNSLLVSRSDETVFFLLNIPSHGNMGDQLIAFAELNLLQKMNSGKRIVAFSTGQIECGVKLLKRVVLPNDVIFITGGGFLGSIYPNEEKRFHDVMRCFPSNKIILFPQTFHYEGKSKLLLRAIALQKLCQSLIIATRESRSYNFIKHHFDNAVVKLLPDMATYLNFSKLDAQRNGILICSRSDKEKSDESSELFERVVDWAKKQNISIKNIDTQVPYAITSRMREGEIDKLIKCFSSFCLVVTDRLHGMLYSIITGTPVIAIDNSTHKVSGAVNDWFSDVPYVCLCEDASSITRSAELLFNMGGQLFENDLYVKKLESLLNYVNS